MKKIISTIIAVCLLLTAFSTIAIADQTGISIDSVTYESTGTYFTITVNGSCEQGSNVSIRVKSKDGTLKALKQFKVKGADAFSYTLRANTAGDESLAEEDGSYVYTVYVRNSNNQATQYEVPLYTEASKLNIVNEKFNSATDAQTMLGYIEKYSKVFGLNLKYFDGMELAVSDYLVKNKNIKPLTLNNIVDSYDDAVIRAYLFNDDKTADRTEIVEYPDYSTMLQFETGINGAKSLYPDYKAMDSDSKAKVNEIVFTAENSMIEFSKLKEKFFMAVVETVFDDNAEDSTKIYDFLKNHNDWLVLKNLTNLSTYDAYQIILKIGENNIPDNKTDFANMYNVIYAQVCKDMPVNNPTSGGGGGASGGGSGAGVVTEEIGYEKPEAPTEIKPIETITFDDIDGYDWAKEAIKALAAKGIVNGKGNGLFAPADNITREEFAKILSLAYDLHNENVKCDFTDVSADRWSYEYVAVMYENGIITGYPDGTFKPDSFVTREEMAVMLCRVLVRLNIVTEEYETYSSYKDYGDISAFAQNSVRTLSNNNILSGDDRGFFNPKNGATRAEVCKMIYNTGL